MAEEDASEGNQHMLRFLVATDNHLGAFAKCPIRRDDPFVTFEEILQKAKEHDVDFVLLGGDLFDENKPTLDTLHRTMRLFRQYCMGDRPISFQYASDPARDFSDGGFNTANFRDPNYNIGLPVFAIHGNHDDPVGEAQLSAMDLLSVSGLINYFGKSSQADNIEVSPLLLTKGRTKVALYGLGHIRDERLYRSFEHKKVKFLRPEEDPESWFNIMMLHQNRGTRGHMSKNGIPESMLAGPFDLAIWGHEHEQRAYADRVGGADDGFDVIQPGSSVISGPKSEDDANPKKVILVEVRDTSYRVTPLTLESARPVEFQHVTLADEEGLQKNQQEVTEYLMERVEELIVRSKEKVAAIPDVWMKKNTTLNVPLVRMKVDYHPDFPLVNPTVFGGKFVNRVANPRHMLLNQKKAKAPAKMGGGGAGSDPVDVGQPAAGADAAGTMAERISAAVSHFVNEQPNKSMTMMSELGLTDALQTYVEKGETHAINQHVSNYLESTQRSMWKQVKRDLNSVEDVKIREMAARCRVQAQEEFRSRNGGADAAPRPPAAGQDTKNGVKAEGTMAPPPPRTPAAAAAAAAPPLGMATPGVSSAAVDDMPSAPPAMLPRFEAQDDVLLSGHSASAAASAHSPPERNPRGGRGGGGRGGRGRGPTAQKRATRDLDPAADPVPQGIGGAGNSGKRRRGRAEEQPPPPTPPAVDTPPATPGSATRPNTKTILGLWGAKKR